MAYGYHGNEILMGDSFKWQGYSPYLQAFAKLRLEEISKSACQKDIKSCVFNVPEILTHSTTIFPGVEVPLYNLILALKKENEHHPYAQKILSQCKSLLKQDFTLEEIAHLSEKYYSHPVIRSWNQFDSWPMHNGKEQMSLMLEQSKKIVAGHKNPKELLTKVLSQYIFLTCGKVMYRLAAEKNSNFPSPVIWLGHDLMAKGLALIEK